ncbi:MAG: DUF1592 domain-containing protein, partial [Pseudomonadota bacterium]
MSSSSDSTVEEVQEFAKASAIIQANCVQCHAPGKSASVAPMNFGSSAEFIRAGLVVPGDVDRSKLIARLNGYEPVKASQGLGPRDMPVGGSLTDSQIEVLKQWVNQLDSLDQSQPSVQFTCVDDKATGMTPSQILTKNQYKNALADLFGGGAVSNASGEIVLVPDDSFNVLTRDRMTGMTKYHIEAYHRVAKKISAYVLASNSRVNSVFGSCASQANPDNTCVGYYLNNTAELIFRRNLTTAEKDRAKSLLYSGSNYREGLERMLTYHLIAPQFLFINEVGTSNYNAANFELSDFEVATRISLMAMDSIPDRALLNIAESGKLKDPVNLRTETLRLLNTPNGRAKVKSVLKTWSSMDVTRDTMLLPNSLQQQFGSNTLESEMVTEVDQFIEYVLYSNSGNFEEL